MPEFIWWLLGYIFIASIVIGIACGIDDDLKSGDKDSSTVLTWIFIFWPLFLIGSICCGLFYGIRYITRKIVLDIETSMKKKEESKRHTQNTPPVSITEQVL